MNKRNPLSEAAITHEEVTVGSSFKCYKPGEGENPLIRGRFVSEPVYLDFKVDAGWAVDVELGDQVIELDLYSLGITPDSSGERWAKVITIYPTEENN